MVHKHANESIGYKDQDIFKMPPFLLVRTTWIAPVTVGMLLLSGSLFALTSSPSIQHLDAPARNAIISLCVILGSILWAQWGMDLGQKKNQVKGNAQSIKEKLEKFVSGAELDLSTNIKTNSKMTHLIVRYAAKNVPGLFDRLITNPDCVSDINIAGDIVSGYLSKHSHEAKRVVDTFSADKLPKKVYNRANLYANRLYGHRK